MTNETKQKLTFLHHAIWAMSKDLEQKDILLLAHLSEFRNGLESYVKQSEDSYIRNVDKGGIKLLHDTCVF